MSTAIPVDEGVPRRRPSRIWNQVFRLAGRTLSVTGTAVKATAEKTAAVLDRGLHHVGRALRWAGGIGMLCLRRSGEFLLACGNAALGLCVDVAMAVLLLAVGLVFAVVAPVSVLGVGVWATVKHVLSAVRRAFRKPQPDLGVHSPAETAQDVVLPDVTDFVEENRDEIRRRLAELELGLSVSPKDSELVGRKSFLECWMADPRYVRPDMAKRAWSVASKQQTRNGVSQTGMQSGFADEQSNWWNRLTDGQRRSS